MTKIDSVLDLEDGTVFWAEKAQARALEDGDAEDGVDGFLPVRLTYDSDNDKWVAHPRKRGD